MRPGTERSARTGSGDIERAPQHHNCNPLFERGAGSRC
jgi:hypothetical protein